MAFTRSLSSRVSGSQSPHTAVNNNSISTFLRWRCSWLNRGARIHYAGIRGRRATVGLVDLVRLVGAMRRLLFRCIERLRPHLNRSASLGKGMRTIVVTCSSCRPDRSTAHVVFPARQPIMLTRRTPRARVLSSRTSILSRPRPLRVRFPSQAQPRTT